MSKVLKKSAVLSKLPPISGGKTFLSVSKIQVGSYKIKNVLCVYMY